MLYDYEEEIYKDILINIKDFDRIRYFRDDHHPKVDPQSKEDKTTVHPWPNQYAIDRFHRSDKDDFMETLNANNVTMLENEFMFVYLLKRSDYKEDKPEETVNYKRFKHLRNYFAIRRFDLWASRNYKLDITLQYRDTFPNDFSDPLRLSNSPLLDYLMRHEKRDELTWKVQVREEPGKYFKIDYTMTDLVFNEMELYVDDPFTLEKKGPVDEVAKSKGYALETDRDIYEKIVDASADNFMTLVTDDHLFAKVEQHYSIYATDSE